MGSFRVAEVRGGWAAVVHEAWWAGPFDDKDDAFRWILAWLMKVDGNMREDLRHREELEKSLEILQEESRARLLEPSPKSKVN